MTQADFIAFYPQFASFTPGVVLTEYIRQANARFEDFGDDTEEARRLYAAHKLTLYATTALPDGANPTKEMIAAAGKGSQNRIASKKVGEVTVTYSNTAAISSASSDLQDLPETAYGLQLLSLLQLPSFSRYVP